VKFSDLREKHSRAKKRPKGLRFFDELNEKSQEFAVSEEQNGGERFDWDDARALTEDFKEQLAERGFENVEVYWSLGYCQGDGVAFYGRVWSQDLKDKDEQAKTLIERLERAGDDIAIEITGANNHYHHWNSMTVEIEFNSELDDDDLPARLKIARPVWRGDFEEYLSEKVKEISRELEKYGYAEIENRTSEETIKQDLAEREHLYAKDGECVMDEFEFFEWSKAANQPARFEKICC
jgi:hypothetical protein